MKDPKIDYKSRIAVDICEAESERLKSFLINTTRKATDYGQSYSTIQKILREALCPLNVRPS